MSCDDNVCGTGGSNLPKPGDPDNNLSLSARTVYGGINVSWSYPTTNPHAVAYTTLYRGDNNVFAQAVELAKVGGSIYFDALNPTVDTTYFYWIQVRSVNGTLADVIGPVSAVAKPRGIQTLESLTNLIDAGVLAQSLKTEIANISANGQAILQEIEDRLEANTALSTALAAVQGSADQAMTYVQQEITQRTEGENALVTSINAIAVGNQNNAAAIIQEQTARVTSDSAMAQQITTLFTKTDQNSAAIISEQTARTTADSAMANSITLLSAQTAAAEAAIKNESTARASADSAIASNISTLTTRMGAAESSILTEQTARVTADSAMASSITTIQSSVYGNVVSGEVGLTTKVTTIDGKVTSIGALYTAKVQVNGLIGGFGVYNDGSLVEAGFDVDRFWIGRTGPDKVKPFIVDSGIVYIDKARIRDADIDTLKIAGNSVMIGLYDEAGANTVGAGSYTDLISRTIDLGDTSNSGLIVSANIACNASDAPTVGFQFLLNGTVVGDQRASVASGMGYLFPVSAFANTAGSRYVTVVLRAYNPTSGPGSNVSYNIGASNMSIMGGKR